MKLPKCASTTQPSPFEQSLINRYAVARYNAGNPHNQTRHMAEYYNAEYDRLRSSGFAGAAGKVRPDVVESGISKRLAAMPSRTDMPMRSDTVQFNKPDLNSPELQWHERTPRELAAMPKSAAMQQPAPKTVNLSPREVLSAAYGGEDKLNARLSSVEAYRKANPQLAPYYKRQNLGLLDKKFPVTYNSTPATPIPVANPEGRMDTIPVSRVAVSPSADGLTYHTSDGYRGVSIPYMNPNGSGTGKPRHLAQSDFLDALGHEYSHVLTDPRLDPDGRFSYEPSAPGPMAKYERGPLSNLLSEDETIAYLGSLSQESARKGETLSTPADYERKLRQLSGYEGSALYNTEVDTGDGTSYQLRYTPAFYEALHNMKISNPEEYERVIKTLSLRGPSVVDSSGSPSSEAMRNYTAPTKLASVLPRAAI